MSEALSVAWIILGAAAVTLLAVIAGVLVVTLLDLRQTSRKARETLESVGPPAAETIENVRDVSRQAKNIAGGVQGATASLDQARKGAGRFAPYVPVVAGVLGALAMLRGRREKSGRR
jgi:hypothetical protein